MSRGKKCHKKPYRDRIGALMALADIDRRGNPNRPKAERRAYRCPRCSRWHLTST